MHERAMELQETRSRVEGKSLTEAPALSGLVAAT